MLRNCLKIGQMLQHFNLAIITRIPGKFCSILYNVLMYLGKRDFTQIPKAVGVPIRNKMGNQ